MKRKTQRCVVVWVWKRVNRGQGWNEYYQSTLQDISKMLIKMAELKSQADKHRTLGMPHLVSDIHTSSCNNVLGNLIISPASTTHTHTFPNSIPQPLQDLRNLCLPACIELCKFPEQQHEISLPLVVIKFRQFLFRCIPSVSRHEKQKGCSKLAWFGVCVQYNKLYVAFNKLLRRLSYSAFYAYVQLGMHAIKNRCVVGTDIHSKQRNDYKT